MRVIGGGGSQSSQTAQSSQSSQRVRPDYGQWVTKAVAASRLDVSTKTIEGWDKDGTLPGTLYRRPTGGPRIRVYDPDRVATLVAERRLGRPVTILAPGSDGATGATVAAQEIGPFLARAPLEPAAALEPRAAVGALGALVELLTAVKAASETSQTPRAHARAGGRGVGVVGRVPPAGAGARAAASGSGSLARRGRALACGVEDSAHGPRGALTWDDAMTNDDDRIDLGDHFLFDKASWGDGPWQDEPDRVEWRHAGLPCLANRAHMGHWCGYVAVPPGHPYHSKDTDDVEAQVHGGLTYASLCDGAICHVPAPGEPDDVWWFGWDAAHAFDLVPSMAALRSAMVDDDLPRLPPGFEDVYRDLAYVQAETNRLAEQLAGVR